MAAADTDPMVRRRCILLLAEAPRMTERLERAIVASSATLLREMHTLASATRSAGLLQVSQSAADIEHAMASTERRVDQLAGLPALLEASIAPLAAWEAAQHEAVKVI